MRTDTFKRWAVLCLLSLFAVVAKAETVGLIVTATGLTTSSGGTLPDNRLIQVIANTAGQTPAAPKGTAFVSGSDVVLASFGLDSSTTGIAGSFQIYLTIDRSAFPGLNSGAPLLLRWYDIPYASGQTAPGIAAYGQFTTTSVVDDSTSGWTLGLDGNHASLNFITASNGGSQLDTLGRTALNVLPDAATITGVSPASGPATGGSTVTLTGTGFTGATGVAFGGTPGTGITVNSATSLTVTSPAAASGVVDITVTTTGGTSATNASDRFTFVAAPAIGSLSPASGPVAGGTSIVLTGGNFTGATAVSFGATAATAYTVDSATSLTATSPAGSAGSVSVTVTTIGGTSAGSPFTYVTAPTVVSPTSASVASTSATLGGEVSADGGASVTERGVVFSITSTNANPQLNGSGVTKVTGSGTTGVFTVSATGLSGATSYTYAAYAINSAGTSYSSASTFTTNPLAPVIISASAASGTYGSAIAAYAVTATHAPTSYSATGLPAGLSIDAATGQITGTPTSIAGSPFSVTIGATNAGGTGTATLTFAIAKAPLTVTADAQTKVYGAANPALTATITGFVNGEALATSGVSGAPALATTATAATGVGTPAITTAVGTLVSTNYAFTTFGAGTLTITKAPLTVTADAQTKVYGAANPALTATITGFVNGDTLVTSAISGSPTLATTATAATGVGAPAITVTSGTLVAGNYAFTTFVDGVLTITKAPLTVTADARSRAFGATNPTLTATLTGFVNGETLATSGVTGAAAVTTTATATTPTGSATLTAAVGSLVAGNYALTTFVDGTLTITKATLIVTADAQTRAYGAANPTLTATITGFVNGETLATSDITGSAAVTTTATASTSVGTAALTAAFGTLASNDYSFGFVDGTLTITKAPLIVTADAQTKVYGSANPTLTATLTGFVNGETIATSGVSGLPLLATAATPATGVGTPAITVTLGSLVAANYAFTTFIDGSLTITQAPLTFTANPVGRAYGTANPTFSGVLTGFVNGETLVTSGVSGVAAFSTPATPTSAVATYAITPAAGTLTAANYAIVTFIDGVLTVGQTLLTVTADAQTKVYGAANPTLTATITGFVNGETLASSGITGFAAVTTTATTATPGGSALLTATVGSLVSANYAFGSFINGTLTITKATLIVTADAQTKVYGSANPTLTATITGFVNGETLATSDVSGAASVTTTATAATAVSTPVIAAALGSLTSSNYAFTSFVDGTLTITKAPLTVAADAQTKVYGAAVPTLTVTLSGFVNGETLATADVTGAAAITHTVTALSSVAGSPYTLTPGVGTLASSNYDFTTFTPGLLTVTKASLAVAATTKGKVYGEIDPTLTYAITAGTLFGSDALTGTLTRDAGANVGSYAINQGTLAASNDYTLTYTAANFTITPRPITITADSGQTKVYGSNDPVALSYTIISGSLVGIDTLAGALTRDAGANVGSYAINQGTLTAGTNYTLTYVGANFTITAKPITIAANSGQAKTYGTVDPVSFAYSVAPGALVGSDAIAGAATRASGENAGAYAINQGSLTAGSNYVLTFTPANFTINQAVLTVTADNLARPYGGANPTFTSVIAGFVSADNLANSVTGAPDLTTTATGTSPQGAYAITVALHTLAAANYSFTLVDGTLTVTKAELLVTADAKTKVFGAANPMATYTFTGFLNGDTAVVVTGAPVLTHAATPTSPVGSYGITVAAGTLATTNYTFRLVDGQLTVTKATLLVTADPQTKIYGATVPAASTFTATLSGFVNGETLATAGITGSAAVTTTVTMASGVAGSPYTLTAALGTLASANYDFTFATGAYTVTPAPLTITADAQTKVYGAAVPTLTATLGGFVNGENAATADVTGTAGITHAVTALSSVAGSPYTLTPGVGTLVSTNYAFTNFVPGLLTVTKAPLAVAAATKGKVYGEIDPTLTYAITAGTLFGSDALTGALTRDLGANVGSYAINQGTLAASNDYTLTYTGENFTITARPITITADSGQTKVYGGNDPVTFTYQITTGSLVGSDALTGALTRDLGANVGSYAITQGTLLASANYAVTYAGATFTITAKAIMIAVNSGQAKTYGTVDPASFAYTVPAGALVGSDTIAGAATRAAGENAGAYAINQGSLTAGSNYTITFTSANFTINQAVLTVTADNLARPYGGANPTFTSVIAGFVGADNLANSVTGAPDLATTATGMSPQGAYAITVALHTLAAANYSFMLVDGTLTVTKAELLVTADAKTKVFGAANPMATYTITGFLNGDTAVVVNGAPVLTHAATPTSPVGSYGITVSAGTLATTNYTFKLVDGQLTVTKTTLLVTADAQTKVYGATVPNAATFTATLSGFVNGETLATSGVTGTASVTTTVTAASGVAGSPYVLTAALGTLASANYDFTFATGAYAVTPAPLTITADVQTKVYGATVPTLTATLSGFVNGETLATSDVTGAAAITHTVTALSSVAGSPYTLIPGVGTLASTNYAFTTFAPGTLTVTKAPLAVAAATKSKVYGEIDPVLTYAITAGTLFGSDTLTGALNRDAGTNVGSYAITQGTLAASNDYTLTYTGANLTITARPITITADSGQTKVYGGNDPVTFTYQITTGNLVGSDAFTGALTRDLGANVGSYVITQGTLMAGTNYTLTYAGATFTITAKPITIAANSGQVKTYGAGDPASFSYTVPPGALVGSDTITGAATRAVGENAGAYAINQGTLTAGANYALTFTPANFTINQAVLTVAADNLSRPYGGANPTFTSVIAGFVGADNLANSVTGAPELTTTATGTSPQGAYAITVALHTLAAANYSFTLVDGTLTVTKAELLVTADAKTKVFGAANPMATYTITGFLNGDTAVVVNGAPVLTHVATPTSPVGSYGITVAVGTLATPNYTFKLVDAQLAVTKATLLVTADPQTKVYGANVPNASTFTATLSGFVNGETLATAGVTGTASVTTTVSAASGVAGSPYTLTAAPGTLASANYDFTFATGTYMVTPASLAVVATAKSKVYGDSDPVLMYAITAGALFGSDALTGALTRDPGANVGSYAINQGTLAASNDYTLTYTGANFTITPRPITITADSGQTKVYGGNDPVAFTYQITTGNLVGSDALTGALTRVAGVNVGSYAITQGTLTAGANYTAAYMGANFTITARPITIAADSGQTKAYGSNDPVAFSYTIISGSLVGSDTLAGALNRDSGVNVGSYAITQGTLAASNDYALIYTGANFTITAKPITIAANSGQAKTYGAGDPASFSYTVPPGTLVGSDIVTGAATRAVGENAGAYAINRGSLTAGANYVLTFTPANFTINQAVLTVTADNLARPYGGANPTFTSVIAGFVGADNLANSVTGAPDLTTTATGTSPQGAYAITVALHTLAAANYSFMLVDGTLTVTKAELLVTADAKTKVFGAANPAATYTITGFLNGDTAVVVTGAPVLSYGATQTSPVGSYGITVVAGTLATTNYTFRLIDGQLTVTKATLLVTADAQTKVYGATVPNAATFTATLSGFVNGETLAASGVTGTASVTTTVTAASGVAGSPYALTAALGTLASVNYDFTFATGAYAVTPAPLTITADVQTKVYGAAVPTLTATLSGFVNGENSETADVTGTAAITHAVTALSSVARNPYTLTPGVGTLASSNYAFTTFVPGLLTVTKAPLAVAAATKGKVYGEIDPTLTYAITAGTLFGGDALTGALTRDAGVNVGSYAINQGTLAASNDYTLTYTGANLTITARPITITADSGQTKVYGGNDPVAFTYQITTGNLVGSDALTGALTRDLGANVGSYAITQGTLAVSANYAVTYAGANFTITAKPITIAANSGQVKTYGVGDPASFSYTVPSGALVGSDTITGAATRAVGENAGAYAINQGSLTVGSNYTITFTSANFTINQAVLTVTADNLARPYGGANPTFTSVIAGFVGADNLANSVTGAPDLTTTATGTSPQGAYAITVALHTLAAANYSFTLVDGTLTVTKAELLVTADAKTKVFGAANPTATYTITGFLNGDTAVVVNGAPVLTHAATPTSPVGSYGITVAVGTLATPNYTFRLVDAQLTVTKATLLVTADAQTKVYGATVPAASTFTATLSGFVNGETLAASGITGAASVTTSATAASGVAGSPYTLTAALGTLASANYDFAFATGAYTVTPAPLTITAEAQTKVYGAAVPTLTATLSGFVNGENAATADVTGTAAITHAVTVLSSVAGSPYTLTPGVGTLASSNYAFTTFTPGLLTVTKAPLAIAAATKSKVYGEIDPALTYAITAGTLFGGDTLTGALTRDAGVNVGSYAINQGALAASNDYTLTYTAANLTITARPITITADSGQTKVYGGNDPVAFTYQITTGSLVGSDALTGALTRDAGSNVGSYAITQGTLAVSANYAVTYAGANFTITAKPITIAAASGQAKTYGTMDPASFAYTVPAGALVGSDAIAGAATRAAGENAGAYAINQGTLTAGVNYTLTFTPVNFTINQAVLTVTADNLARPYGGANPTFTSVIAGFVGADNLANSVTGAPDLTTTATATSPQGAYAITVALHTLAAANYSFTLVDGTLTVTKAELLVTADAKTKVFGAANPTATYTITGFLNGDTAVVVTGVPVLTHAATPTSPVGRYGITVAVGTLATPNYTFKLVDAQLAVTKATLLVTADAQTKIYGATVPNASTFTATLSGFVNGETLATADVTGTVSVTTTVTAASGVASSPYMLTAALGTLASANYDFTFATGAYTVTPAPLTITAEAQTKVYGAAVPTLTVTLSGFVNGETSVTAGVTGTAAVTTGATATSPVGTYQITPAGGTLAAANYAFATFTPGTLDVTKAVLLVTADSKNAVFGTGVLPLTATFSGFVNGDTVASAVSGSASLSGGANGAGRYPITTGLGSLSAANYTFSFAPGTLSISAASATITLGNLSQVYDGQAKQASATASPASIGMSVTYSPTPVVNVGSYTVTATVTDPNYVGSATGTLTIAKAGQTLKITAPSTASLGTPVSVSASASSGLPVTLSASGPATLSGGQLTFSGSGAVTLTATQAGNENFAAASASATVTVAGRLPQTIAFTSISDRLSNSGTVTLNATASSGLPLTFAIIGGPAMLTGNAVTLTGATGQVLIRASQAGNELYDPALDVTASFTVTAATLNVFFGTVTNSGGTAKAGDVAATLPPGSQQGTLLVVAPGVGINTVLDFTLNPDGTFTQTVVVNASDRTVSAAVPRAFAAATVTLTLHGSLVNGRLSGVIEPLGLSFSANVLPVAGPSANAAGFYKSSTLAGTSGATYTVVGSGNQVLVLATTPDVTTGGLTTLNTNGTFGLQTQTSAGMATITGTVDEPTTTVAGKISLPGQPETSFAGLVVTTTRTDRLINLSSRVRIGAGDRTLITGFVIGGNEPKQVLIRGVGPALAGFGVQGTLANPRIRVYRGTEIVAENDDWSATANGPALTAVFSRLGAFALADHSADAALLATLPPGAYTAQVLDASTGAAQGTGVALAEIYDASTNPNADYQRLVNISTRGEAGTGENVLIGGFIVTGNAPKKLLIRGIGPGLAAFGVGGTLADPRLRIYQNTALIAENDNWSAAPDAETAALTAAMHDTGAFALPVGSRDAAIILTLAPGSYTAQVGAADGLSTGIALVEIYELPQQ